MILEKITQLIIDLEIDEISNTILKALYDENIDPLSILNALKRGMDEVGRRYEIMEYYLAELMLAGETMKIALDILKPILSLKEKPNQKGKIIICTVKGDLHEIGKNLLGTLLLSSGFNVIDLGVDVSAETIIKELKKSKAKIIALSSLLSTTVKEIKNIHDLLIKEGLRGMVKIIVGGAPLNMELAKKFGADDYADDVVLGVKHIINLIKEQTFKS
ncbi:MAG: B12-binding domain-containing protein [Promethearchaeota archaeon]